MTPARTNRWLDTPYLHHDQLGLLVLITDSARAGGTATTNTVDSFGNVVSTSGSLTTPVQPVGAAFV